MTKGMRSFKAAYYTQFFDCKINWQHPVTQYKPARQGVVGANLTGRLGVFVLKIPLLAYREYLLPPAEWLGLQDGIQAELFGGSAMTFVAMGRAEIRCFDLGCGQVFSGAVT